MKQHNTLEKRVSNGTRTYNDLNPMPITPTTGLRKRTANFTSNYTNARTTLLTRCLRS